MEGLARSKTKSKLKTYAQTFEDLKLNKGGKFISDMEIEVYRFEDYMNYPLNRTSALREY